MRIGTRGSALALAQAGTVAQAVGAELVAITTTGDRNRGALDKERWTRELDLALLAGEIDAAVHSAKDVPVILPDGIEIAVVPLRADPRDALCGAASLAALAPGAVVGTSSLRRAAQLRSVREDLKITELRGNIDTRLARLAGGDYDAIVLALAGLQRLGREAEATGALTEFVPCSGQGALAITTRSGDAAALSVLRELDDDVTHRCLLAERAVVHGLDADCHSAMGAYATIAGETITLQAFAGRVDGSAWLSDELTGPAAQPQRLGAQVAERLRSAGADAILERAPR